MAGRELVTVVKVMLVRARMGRGGATNKLRSTVLLYGYDNSEVRGPPV